MLQLLFAVLLASTVPGPPPAQVEPQVTITGDPATDAPIVCLKMVSDKVKAALDGKPPVSDALVTYSVAFKLTDEQKEKLARDCTFFEAGFMIGVAAERQGLLMKPIEKPESKGLTTTF